LQRIPEQLSAILLQRADLVRIAGDKMISALAMTEQNQAARQKGLDAVDALQQTAVESRDELTKRCTDAQNQVFSDPSQQMLLISQKEALWRRIKAQLDRGDDYLQLINDAATRGDSMSLSVMRDEFVYALPQDEASSAIALIKDLEIPLLDPDVRKAVLAQRDLDRGYPRIQMSLNYARSECQGNGPQSLLPGFDADSMIRVSEELLGQLSSAQAAFLRGQIRNEPGVGAAGGR
jgi:hypothetical protein